MIIQSDRLNKFYYQTEKEPGILGSLRSFIQPKKQKKIAVDQFDLQIEPGELVGLLGPNGAGKTTLMKMFTGIIVPSSGRLSILGYEPSQRKMEFRKKIALVMGQKSQLWWDIPAIDSFHLLKAYYELDDLHFKNRLNELTELLDCSELLKVHVRRLSLGERMKMELIASLLHQPEIVFLDEPTIGLDLISQEKIRNFVSYYRDQFKTTFIITSHYMADIEALCNRIVLIHGGKKVYDGSIQSFANSLGSEKSLTLYFADSIQSSEREFFASFSPVWNDDFRKVTVQIPLSEFSQKTIEILNQFSVFDLATDKTPIESVMKAVLENPDRLKSKTC